MYVLDTNTIIYYFKGQGKVAEYLSKIPLSELAVPSIVWFELKVGIAKSNSPDKRLAQFNALMVHLRMLPFTDKEADISAMVRAKLERLGTPIGMLDILIAGTALAHEATLVTHNVREFSRVEGLKIVDWYV
jgi:tRNA(fMet)-specific endonuclease VapC